MSPRYNTTKLRSTRGFKVVVDKCGRTPTHTIATYLQLLTVVSLELFIACCVRFCCVRNAQSLHVGFIPLMNTNPCHA